MAAQRARWPARVYEMAAGQRYAAGGTERGQCGYNFLQYVDHRVEVRQRFAERVGAPKRAIVTGGSRGGFVARLALERYPKIFDAAMTSAGGARGPSRR